VILWRRKENEQQAEGREEDKEALHEGRAKQAHRRSVSSTLQDKQGLHISGRAPTRHG